MRSERCMQSALAAAAWISAAAAVLIFLFMAVLGWPLLGNGDLMQVLCGPWSPMHHQYGIRPMILGTLCIASLALALAVPVSLGCAVFIQVTAPKGLGRALHHLVRLMTGIPTVVYGFVGIFLLVPLVRNLSGHGAGLSILSAGLMLSLLIAPTMILFFVQGLAAVPQSHRQAACALGATPVQQLIYVLLPQARRTLLAGVVLGLGRAMGDTLIALMLAGNSVATPQSILDPTRTLTAHIALIIAADFESPEFRTLFICALILYLMTTLAVAVMRRLAAKPVEIP
ncbi:MAG: phosphate ABC transporter permease subunit PstC [Desulfobacteraceae bacterium]|nr:phosphate ABC transporter permease subunit PstC [Desulfobacteraceae bacterium]